jgi:hypothetical protein
VHSTSSSALTCCSVTPIASTCPFIATAFLNSCASPVVSFASSCGCREGHPCLPPGLSVPRSRQRGCLLMVLSFLYLAFVRVVQLVRLSCCAQDDLAIEILILRHEVARSRHPSGPPRRGDGQSRRRLGHPAGPQPLLRPGGTDNTDQVPHSRSRHEVHCLLRRRLRR